MGEVTQQIAEELFQKIIQVVYKPEVKDADIRGPIADALRRAKAEGLEQVSELRKALELYRDASYQGHSSHWDKTGGSGSGCPACLRAIELRAQARQIVDTLDARAAQIEEGE